MRIVTSDTPAQATVRADGFDGRLLLRSAQTARPATPVQAIGQAMPRDGLQRRMSMAAKARFAANKRLEAKAVATNVGLQLANIYTIAISILLLQFPNSDLLKPLANVLNYISLIASVFVQIMAMIETNKDYSGRARRMHECAMGINSLAQRLEIDPRTDWQTLEWYRAAYEGVIREFDVNHDAVDYRCAQLDPARVMPRNRRQRLAVLRWRLAYLANVYGLTVCILVSPWLLGWGLIVLGLR